MCEYSVFLTSFNEEIIFPHCILFVPLLKLNWPYILGLFLKGKAFSFSILHMLLIDVGFSYMIFVTVRYIPSVLWFLSTELSGNDVNYVKTFFYLYQDDHTIFFLLVMLCITLVDLVILNHLCILRKSFDLDIVLVQLF